MKKLKFLFVLLVALMILPYAVLAEEDEETTNEAESAEVTESTTDSGNSSGKEVKIYFFRGEGCSHCAEAMEWFNSIEEEYGSFFELEEYEVWQDEDNASLMQEVAEARGETAEGVPYIIIGDKSWNGFAESYEQEMIDQIKSMFEQDVNDRYDIMTYLKTGKSGKKAEEKSSGDVIALLVILAVVGGGCFAIYKLRDSASE